MVVGTQDAGCADQHDAAPNWNNCVAESSGKRLMESRILNGPRYFV